MLFSHTLKQVFFSPNMNFVAYKIKDNNTD